MKILLINPSLTEAATGQYEQKMEQERGVYPPLGLAYIAAALEEKNHEIKIVDCDVEKNYEEKILQLCRDWQPEMAGFYAMTWNYRLADKLSREIKKINSLTITVLGGPNVTTMPKASLQFGNFDFGIMGEGEKTIIELIDQLVQKDDLNFEKILGLVWRKDGQIIINPTRPLIDDLDTISFPARHLLPMEKYFDVFSKNKKFATIIATRGCPFNCTFCDRQNRMGRKWRRRSPQNIAQEIKQIIERYDIREFMFFDDNLIIDKDWAYQLMSELKNLKITWECRERVDMIDEPILKAMKEAGCYRIRFGFESGDNRILKVLKKDITVEQSLACAKLCQKVGIEIFGYFIIGAPQETAETIKKTINLALKISSDFALFSKMILIPGSEIFDYGVKTDQIREDYWKRFIQGLETDGAPSLTKETLSEKIIDENIKLADRKFYFRPIFILKKIMAIKNLNHLIKQAKLAFALFFKTKKSGDEDTVN